MICLFQNRSMTSLIDMLAEVKDHRRDQGKRVPFAAFIEMILVACLNGATPIRAIHRFIDNNSEFFVKRYGLIHGTPSYAGLREFLGGLDFDIITDVFARWASQYIEVDDWLSIDGKALGSTVTDKHSSRQNFQFVVSSFSAAMEIAIDSVAMENKESHEGDAARELISRFEQKGCVFTLDALHCQKKLPE